MTTYYVSTTGSNSSSGSEASPFRSINHAVNYSGLKPGDTIIVKPGTYTEQVVMQKDGAANGYITLQSEVPGQALIRPPSGGYSTVSIRADYVVVDGFDVAGGSGHGIEAQHVHHTAVRNNTVHDSGSAGIQYDYSEFITIEGNNVYKNASTGYLPSGISIYENRNITGDTTTEGYRTIVRNNISHDNRQGPSVGGDHQDGNGIIIDDFRSTQNSAFPSYNYPTLVDNNVVYGNGSKGIHVTWSDNVTVSNNTAYHNNQDPLNQGTWRAELSNSQSSNNTWVNNIAVTDPGLDSDNTAIGNYSYSGYVNQNVQWDNNVTFNGTAGQASLLLDGGNAAPSAANGNLLGANPMFVDASSGNFALQSGSPAIDAGTATYGLAVTDLAGHARVVGTVDIGAYESGSSDPSTPPTPTEPTPTQPAPTETPTFTGQQFTGTTGNDTIIGNDLDNTIDGGRGNDLIKGGLGNDHLNGGAGADQLWGGSGNDRFSFGSVSAAKNEKIVDFAKGDIIDFSTIDARSGTSTNDTFKFMGTDAFTGAGQVHFKQDAAKGITYIEGNTNSNPAADLVIEVKGLHNFAATDFLL